MSRYTMAGWTGIRARPVVSLAGLIEEAIRLSSAGNSSKRGYSSGKYRRTVNLPLGPGHTPGRQCRFAALDPAHDGDDVGDPRAVFRRSGEKGMK